MLLGLYVKAQTFWGAARGRITDERGAVATEYALLLVLIAVAIAATVGLLGTAILNKFNEARACLEGPCP
jgi:Flp pilus assembly pilin Flp